MKQNIVVLYNSFSAAGKGRRIASKIRDFLVKNNVQHVLFENDWPADLSNFTQVMLVGGDGTMNYFLNFYPNLQLPLLLFAGGTGNDIHWKLYGRLDVDAQLVAFAKYTPKLTDLGECRIDGAKRYFFINGVGIGFDGEVLRSMRSIRFLGGHLGYLWVVIKQIFSYRENVYSINFAGKQYQKKCTLLNIANSSRTGGGFMVSPQAQIDDGLLNLMHCFTPSVIERLKVLPKVEKGLHLSLKSVEHCLLDEVNISAEQNVAAQLDGEFVEGQRFDIQISERKLLVLC